MNARIAFYATPFPRIRSYYDMIDLAADYGTKVIEGFNRWELKTPDPESAKRLRDYADKKGIRFVCLSCYCEIRPEDTPVQIQNMKAYADIAGILDSPWLHHTLVSGYTDPGYVADHSEMLLDNAVTVVQQVYDYAESVGVKPIYENQGYLINGVNGFWRFLEKADRDVGVLLDTGNIYSVDETPDAFFTAFKERIVHVHLKDVCYRAVPDSPGWRCTRSHRYYKGVAPGKGIVDLKGIVTQLECGGYHGCYALEFGAESDDSPVIDDSVDHLSRLLAVCALEKAKF